ncbi:glycoside hydrolase family 3 protein [Athelia psychrophila]|uniref:beta-glucosidase n=1 Tax=Athelia psychrophila TaxID=1759441 RepID=A0A166LVC6_9AGAM|nr:glycoside hydrolase family 3 protein [Fibularhizoctonia sp. CBS 109695]
MNDRTAGGHILLGPTVNAQRSPLGGRSFESFSEDPHVNGTISATYINGLQSKDVAAAIKHYVANDQEFERSSISMDVKQLTPGEVSERALREIYLKPFQIAIHDSKPRALTTSCNRIGGQHISEDKRTVQDINILKAEWGLGGMTMSDWMGVYNTAESIKAELYLEMPSPPIVLTGSEVAQVCIADPQSTLPRPPKELHEGGAGAGRQQDGDGQAGPRRNRPL